MPLHGCARGRTRLRFPQTIRGPATGSRCRAAWLPSGLSRRGGAPHSTDFVGQDLEQVLIGVAGRRATEVQAPERIWNMAIPTRVALIIVVDDHRHDEAAIYNGQRSFYCQIPFLENVAFPFLLRVRRDDRDEYLDPSANRVLSLMLPGIPRAYPALV